MKVCVLLITLAIVMGCGRQNGTTRDSISQTKVAPVRLAINEPHDVDSAYAKGIVTRKNGTKREGYILLQCPGYLTVCFEINSSEPGSSELVPIEDVKCVKLEETLDDVDPFWKKLQEEITVVTPRSDAGGSNR